MTYVFGTFIVTLGVRAALQDLSTHLDRMETDGMYTTALSPTGIAPATHYISTGMAPLKYAQAMANPTKMFNDASAAYAADGTTFPYTQLQVTNSLAKCDVTQDDPFIAMARMGLQLIQPTAP